MRTGSLAVALAAGALAAGLAGVAAADGKHRELIDVPAPRLAPNLLQKRGRPAAPTAEEEEELGPEVTIRKSGPNTIEEYRINNRVYKVKVQPQVGPAYYLIDTDGDGLMDRRYGLNDPPVVAPQWVLKRW